jgi:sterol desaturase/sphingolipid hydroxylase (fatty acid hydroxylase superfamily)
VSALLSRALDAGLALGLLAAVFWPLERAFPARPRQRWLRAAFATDLAFFAGQSLLWGGVALGALQAFHQALGPDPLGVHEGLAGQPVWLQTVEVVLAGDLGVYGFHRACHRVGALWRFHAVHHSAPALDWLAAHREHPLDGLCTQLAVNLPALLVGFPMVGLLGLAGLRGMWAILIHANVKLPLGPLRWVLGAPELHHWHHRRDGAAQNFGNLAPWTDWLFGTYHRPTGEETWALGVAPSAQGEAPEGYLGLLVWPFRTHAPGHVDAGRAPGPAAAPDRVASRA